ncbi:MAG: restriction endonuclease [Syntrophobacteraceae bacterium]
MKILQVRELIHSGTFPDSELRAHIFTEIRESIICVKWPPGSDKFTLYPEKHRNGVTTIKKGCMEFLREKGWQLEQKVDLGNRLKPGKVDAVKTLPDGRFFALEWETGNISSSHRALNKLAIGLLDNLLAGGVLVLPSRAMYNYLTDRVGNYDEIRPYFPVWECLQIPDRLLAVIEIEHDELSLDVPVIGKGTDGRALR